MERKINIDNFIGVYDGYILPEECDKVIKLYEAEDKLKKTFSRIGLLINKINNILLPQEI